MKVGKQSILFNNIFLGNAGVVVGPKEKEGPIGNYFDYAYEDLYCGQKTWEKAEIQLLKDSIRYCLNKNNLGIDDIDCFVGGDLNNQITTANYCMREYDIPLLGVFGACSTSTEAIIIASCLLQSNYGENILAATSSHNAISEKQFRYPTEYGGQKPDSLTVTTTAAGVGLITKSKTSIKITKATIGRVIDGKFDDPLDLGRAMAPAAYSTLKQHFIDFKCGPNDYDLIVTGDLSFYGHDMVIKLFSEDNIDMKNNYNDCGLIIYDRSTQNVFAGGGGCGCCAAVTFGFLINKLKDKTYNKILVCATGALHNPIIIAQKESIPSIAHAVVLERSDES